MNDTINVLAVGDLIGRPGRRAATRLIPQLRRELGIDMVIANGENASGGFGLSPGDARDLFNCGVDVITCGNHIWDQKEIISALDDMPILRPMNYPPGTPGKGYLVHDLGERGRVAVANVQGLGLHATDRFTVSGHRRLLAETEDVTMRMVDIHAEATSERQAMAHYLDGKVSLLWGTHTHTPTADQRVMPGGTAFVSDLGMVGPTDSVIGMDAEGSLRRFLTGIPQRFKVARGMVTFNSVVVGISVTTDRAESIERVDHTVDVSSGD